MSEINPYAFESYLKRVLSALDNGGVFTYYAPIWEATVCDIPARYSVNLNTHSEGIPLSVGDWLFNNGCLVFGKGELIMWREFGISDKGREILRLLTDDLSFNIHLYINQEIESRNRVFKIVPNWRGYKESFMQGDDDIPLKSTYKA